MGIELAFKETDAGRIPQEWSAKPLTGRVAITHGYAFSSEHFSNSGIYRLTTPGHFNEEGGFRDIGNKQKFFVGPVSDDYVLRPGDLIVAMTEQADGLLGSAAFVPEGAGYLHNQRLGRIRVLNGELHPAYLFWVFNSPRYRAKVRESAAGTKVKHTSPAKLLEIVVPIPPIPEQRAIAAALSDMDALLHSLDRLIAKKRDLKHAAMQQLLTGKTRLPGFRHTSKFTQTEIGGIPEDWVLKHVRDISIVGRGRVISHREIAASHSPVYPVYSSQTSNDGIMGYLDNFDFDGEYITWTTDGANAGTVFHRTGKFNCTNVCGILKLKADNAAFVSRVLGRITPHHVSWNLGNPKLMNDAMKRIRIPLPSRPEQDAIAEVLSDMDAELAALEQRREKTRLLKQSMMQELLTGKTRLI